MLRLRGAQALSKAAAFALRTDPSASQSLLGWTSLASTSRPSVRGLAQEAVVHTEAEAQPRGMSASTRRSGVLAVKVGMTQEWDNWGARLPISILWVDGCKVVQAKTDDREGYTALQVGIGAKREKQVAGTQRGHFAKAGVPILRKLAEFRVTPDAVLPPGTELRANLFVPGQYVDVCGTSIGKGFAGVMKRWGFKGQPASHGASLAHRVPGSTGGNQDPGKVWKGKKLPGRLGGVRKTVQNCLVYKVDATRNLIYVVGQVPGHKGNFVRVADAVKKAFEQQPMRPLVPPAVGQGSGVATLNPNGRDPYDFQD
ncbi:MRPL3 [Auxenochlorella protothecoides x Auxenochlorella symbiontica]